MKKVRILKTLKSGQKIWLKGEVIHPPLPPDIEQELLLNTGTVEEIEGYHPRPVREKSSGIVGNETVKPNLIRVPTRS